MPIARVSVSDPSLARFAVLIFVFIERVGAIDLEENHSKRKWPPEAPVCTDFYRLAVLPIFTFSSWTSISEHLRSIEIIDCTCHSSYEISYLDIFLSLSRSLFLDGRTVGIKRLIWDAREFEQKECCFVNMRSAFQSFWVPLGLAKLFSLIWE